jgi:hypothetical protein
MAGRLAAVFLLGCVACQTSSASQSTAVATSPVAIVSRLIYAAQGDGQIHIYDMARSHRLIKTIEAFPCCVDVRGAAAAAATHRFYVMYNRGTEGHLVALDLLTDRILWNHVMHSPGVDRGNLTPDGMTLYLPTFEGDPNSPYELVVDAITGEEVGRVALPARSHDTIVSLDGKRVFMETKSPTHAMYVADTATNKVVQTISGYCCTGVLAPFSINGAATKIVNDVTGYYGFSVADVTTGRVVAMVPFAHPPGTTGHGIAWSPDERRVWADDGGLPLVHVFDMSTSPPREVEAVKVANIPHWITFSIDGRYAYVAGRKGQQDPTQVIDASTFSLVQTLDPSEDLLEVDKTDSDVVAVGNQFGVGRVTH